MSNRFTYVPRATEQWTQRAEQTGGSYIGFIKDSIETYSAKKENWLRILPPTWPDAKHYGFDCWVHYGVGPQNASVLCNLKMYNTPCSVCEAYTKADAEGREDAYEFKATRRVLIWMVDRQDEGDVPVAWASPWTLDRDISKLCKDRQTGELYMIDHPEAGYDITFDREGELPNVKYVGIQIARRPSSVAEKYIEYIIERPLPSLLIKRTYEEVRALFEGAHAVDTNQPQPGQEQPPVQQPQQQQTSQFPPQPPNLGVQPQFQQPVQVPVQQQPQFCPTQISFQGNHLGCAYQQGHQGPCLFERVLSSAPQVVEVQQPVQQQQPTPPVTARTPLAPQQPVQQPIQQPTSPGPALVSQPGGSRAEALRARFAQK